VALDLLARKAWTRQELRRRLCRRGAPDDVAEAVVADFEGRGYLDDRAFASVWATSRARDRAVGSYRLRAELLARGVARPLAEAAVDGAFDEVDELTRARAAATRRLGTLGRAAPAEVSRRIHDYLRRRGYPGDVVRQVVRALCPTGLSDAEG
jgi:regulatory protein